MKKTALFLFMLFAFAMKAQEMVLLGEATDKNMKYYIYPKTVRESERSGYITAWFLYEFPAPQKSSNSKYYVRAKNQFLINCKYNKFGILTTLLYSKDDTLIKNIGGMDEYLVKEVSTPPRSNAEIMVKAACYIYDKMSNQNQE
jgi:hypothetical protein